MVTYDNSANFTLNHDASKIMYTPPFFRFHSISETCNVKNLHWTSLERCVHLAALRCWWHHPITPLLPPQPLHVNLLLHLPKTHSQHFQICDCEVRRSLRAVTPVLLKRFANEAGTISWFLRKIYAERVGDMEENERQPERRGERSVMQSGERIEIIYWPLGWESSRE